MGTKSKAIGPFILSKSNDLTPKVWRKKERDDGEKEVSSKSEYNGSHFVEVQFQSLNDIELEI